MSKSCSVVRDFAGFENCALLCSLTELGGPNYFSLAAFKLSCKISRGNAFKQENQKPLTTF